MHAHPIVHIHLKRLFQLIMQHGHFPMDFKSGVVIPVVKNIRRSVDNVDNYYRPVTTISVISKLFKMHTYKTMGGYLKAGGLR